MRLAQAPSEAASDRSSRSLGDLLRMGLAVRRDALDAFLFPSAYTYFPTVGTPTVVGIHDAISSEFPQLTTSNARSRFLLRAKERIAIARATRLFTVSEASRAAIARRFGVRASRLTIVTEAPDPLFRPADVASIVATRAAIGLGAAEPFLLYAGGISPHKNLATLVAAYARLRRPRPRLVAVGDLEREAFVSSADAVRRQIASLDLTGDVLLPGFVSDEALAALYTGAAAVVLPSLAEGFGLPAVEAAACGAPLILSDIPAHRETLGGAARFFPPRDAEALAAEITRLLDDDAVRTDVAARCQARVAHRSWRAAADTLKGLLREAAGGS